MKKKFGAVLLVVALALSLGVVTAVSANAGGALPHVNWLPPLSNQGDFQLKDGSTLPIKFTLTDPNTGAFVEDTGVKVDVNEVLFWDDFSSYTPGTNGTPVWTPVTGNWSVRSGTQADGTVGQVYSQNDISDTNAQRWSLAGDGSWTDYVVEAKAKGIEGHYSGHGTHTWDGIVFRAMDNTHFYEYYYRTTSQDIIVVKHDGGTRTVVSGPVSFTCDNGMWYNLKVVAKGNSFRFYADGVEISGLAFTDPSFASGKVGVYVWDGSEAQFDDVMVTALPATKTFPYGTGDDSVRIAYDTVFSDDFEDGKAVGWQVLSGVWSIVDDAGNYVYNGTATADEQVTYALSVGTFDNFVLEARVKAINSAGHYGIVLREDGTGKHYGFYLNAYPASEGKYYFGYWAGSYPYYPIVPWTDSGGAYTDAQAWNTLKVVANGYQFKLYINSILVNTVSDTNHFAASGHVGLIIDKYVLGQNAYFDDVTVQVPHYIANLHTKENGMVTGDYLITVWSGSGDELDTYLFDLTDAIQGKGRGKGKA